MRMSEDTGVRILLFRETAAGESSQRNQILITSLAAVPKAKFAE